MRTVLPTCLVVVSFVLVVSNGNAETTDIKGRWTTPEGIVEIYEIKGQCNADEEKPIHKHFKLKLCEGLKVERTRLCGRVVDTTKEGKALLEGKGPAEDALGLPVLCVELTDDRKRPWQGRVFKADSISKQNGQYAMKDYNVYIVASPGDPRSLEVEGCLGRRLPGGFNCETFNWCAPPKQWSEKNSRCEVAKP